MARPRPHGVSVIVPPEKVREIATTTFLQEYLESVFKVLDMGHESVISSSQVSEKGTRNAS